MAGSVLQGVVKCGFVFVVILQAWLVDGGLEKVPKEALPTRSGYLDVNTPTASSMFFVYYEALEPTDELSKTPVVLWLQVGNYALLVRYVSHDVVGFRHGGISGERILMRDKGGF